MTQLPKRPGAEHRAGPLRRSIGRGRGGLRAPTALVLALASVLALLVGSASGKAGEVRGARADASEGRIAFSAGQTAARQDVYIVNADASGVRRLTSSSAGEFDPSWSPTGRRIAYRRETPQGQPDIYTMNADGSQKRNLTRGSGGGISPTWSPDGRQIAFASVRGGSLTELWVMKADGSDQRRVGRVNGEYPDWSPDGRRIVFDHMTLASGDWDIWVVSANGSGARPLVAWRGSKEQGASWSPDGRWVAFQSDRGASDGLPRVWIARADGSSARRLTDQVGERPTWSPDGTRISFTANVLFVASRDGASVREVTVAAPGYFGLADWGR